MYLLYLTKFIYCMLKRLVCTEKKTLDTVCWHWSVPFRNQISINETFHSIPFLSMRKTHWLFVATVHVYTHQLLMRRIFYESVVSKSQGEKSASGTAFQHLTKVDSLHSHPQTQHHLQIQCTHWQLIVKRWSRYKQTCANKREKIARNYKQYLSPEDYHTNW